MKKAFIIIAAFAFASAAFAQSTSEALSPKEVKAKKAAELKAFKEKQKADLEAFIAQQNAPQANKKPVMNNQGDSVAYIMGVAQSNGLMQYIKNNLGVDTAFVDVFAKSVMESIGIDLSDPSNKAKDAGRQIASQIRTMTENFSKDYYSADPGMTVDPSIVAQGVMDGLLGTSGIRPTEAGTHFQDVITKRQAANKEKLWGPNREAGEKFLAENKTKPGVVTLPSGLQYKVITEGTGEKPTATDKVTVHYEGTLIDGTVFDSSYKRSSPTTFGVTQVIKGWTEALQLMPEGSKWMLYIPYDLAYGDRETGKEIKPYSALIFTVELISIVKPEAKKAEDDAKKMTGAKGKTTTKKK